MACERRNSGGNRLHGSLYEFLRNDVLDARNFFDAGKSKLIQNQFGATVSGPVVLPKLYHGKDKTFFFVDYEGSRNSVQIFERGNIPTLRMRQGEIRNSVGAVLARSRGKFVEIDPARFRAAVREETSGT